jgi:hypothetical protein
MLAMSEIGDVQGEFKEPLPICKTYLSEAFSHSLCCQHLQQKVLLVKRRIIFNKKARKRVHEPYLPS